VWETLKRINPADKKGNRRYRNWRFLTEDIGNPHLEKQLIAVTTSCDQRLIGERSERLFERAFSASQSQLPLIYPEEAEKESER